MHFSDNRTSLLKAFKVKTARGIRHSREPDELSSYPGVVRKGGGEAGAPVPAKSIHDNQSPEDPTRPYTASERHDTSKLTAYSDLKHTHTHTHTQYITSVSAFRSPQRSNSNSSLELHYLLTSLFLLLTLQRC
jgi:hypothetical protein